MSYIGALATLISKNGDNSVGAYCHTPLHKENNKDLEITKAI